MSVWPFWGGGIETLNLFVFKRISNDSAMFGTESKCWGCIFRSSADKKSQWNQHQRLYHHLQDILLFRSTKLSSTNLTSATLKHPHTFFQDSEALVAESHHPIPSAEMTLKAHQLVRRDSLSYPSISCSLLKVFRRNGFHDLAII